MKTHRMLLVFVGGALAAAFPAPVEPASHQWRFNEVFSNADGTIQFVELKECCGFLNEVELQSKWILVVGANHKYTFRSDLLGTTANKHLLLGTQAYADLPGVPAPDYIIPPQFLPVGGDTLEYWQYALATWIYPALPLDGAQSLHISWDPDDQGGGLYTEPTSGQNSPTNFDGETGTVDLTTPVRSVTWGAVKAWLDGRAGHP